MDINYPTKEYCYNKTYLVKLELWNEIKVYLVNVVHTINPFKTLRLRGSGNDFNNDKTHNEIPYLSKIGFLWNGLPMIDFQEFVMNPLNNGLGSISMKDATLLATVQRSDPGGVFGNPTRAAALPDTVKESDARNVKAASCILNYINPKSEIYFVYSNMFSGDGIAIYNHMKAYGKLTIPDTITAEREDIWNNMTLDKLKLQYSHTGYWKWIEAVMTVARKLSKDGHQQKTKFHAGLPTFFNVEKTHLAQITGKYLFPARYGLLPGFAGTSVAATPHPLAGQPDIMAYGRAYFALWVQRSSNLPGRTPRGLVRSVEALMIGETIVDDVEACADEPILEANLAASDITPKTKCTACGGDQHAASQILPDGEKLFCAKVTLDRARKNGELTPNHNNADSAEKYKRKARAYAKKVETLVSELESAHRIIDTQKRNNYRRRDSSDRDAHSAESGVESDDSFMDSDAFTTNDDDDDASSNASAHVQDFADAVQQQKKRGKDLRYNKKRH